MANITIRNLDDDVVEQLKDRARAHHRSLEAELRQILSEAARRPGMDELKTLAERIARLTPAVPQSDSTHLIREDRER
jgi:plasmid stability protein